MVATIVPVQVAVAVKVHDHVADDANAHVTHSPRVSVSVIAALERA
jgi:hypothetical protein